MNRIQALIIELRHDWDELNLSAKSLVIIGIFLLITVVYFAVTQQADSELQLKIKLIFKSSFASVFGFLLSSNTKNDVNNSNKSPLARKFKDDDCEEICKRIKKYNYGNGNTVQIVIALITTVVTGLTILFIYNNRMLADKSIVAEFGDLMCMAIGFLLGESKIRSD